MAKIRRNTAASAGLPTIEGALGVAEKSPRPQTTEAAKPAAPVKKVPQPQSQQARRITVSIDVDVLLDGRTERQDRMAVDTGYMDRKAALAVDAMMAARLMNGKRAAKRDVIVMLLDKIHEAMMNAEV